MRRPCHACPDGQFWTVNGPTTKACPVCGGKAFLDGDAVEDLPDAYDFAEDLEDTNVEDSYGR